MKRRNEEEAILKKQIYIIYVKEKRKVCINVINVKEKYIILNEEKPWNKWRKNDKEIIIMYIY